jgi:hypothetical protein
MWSSLVAGSMLAWPGRLSRGGPQNRVVRWAFDSVDWSDSGLSGSPRAMLPSSIDTVGNGAGEILEGPVLTWVEHVFPSRGAGPPAARWEEGLERRVAWCWGQAWSRAS